MAVCNCVYDDAMDINIIGTYGGSAGSVGKLVIGVDGYANDVTTQRMPTALASVPHGSLCWTQHDSESARWISVRCEPIFAEPIRCLQNPWRKLCESF